jgi:UDP-3-O-[3-hydroxymyristoyl] glucosamine N-acyltransferase
VPNSRFPDPRFYEAASPVTVADLIVLTGARLDDPSGADRLIIGVAPLDAASGRDVSFCADKRHGRELAASAAGAVFVAPAQASGTPSGCVAMITDHPQASYAQAADRLFRPRALTHGAQPVDRTASLEEGVIIAPGAVVGPDAQIGQGTIVGPGAVIGAGVTIGRDCIIGPRAVVVFAILGDRVRLHAGAVIGEPGFGAAVGPHGVVDIPQLGRVSLQNGVTVGANSCVDRGAFDDTVIGENTKIDNLVQIAHNVVIGRNCVLAAHTGVSGSTTIGDGCMLGGRVGIADHITVGAGAKLAAASGVMKDVPSGETWGGTPARPIGRWLKETAVLARLAMRRNGWEDRS